MVCSLVWCCLLGKHGHLTLGVEVLKDCDLSVELPVVPCSCPSAQLVRPHYESMWHWQRSLSSQLVKEFGSGTELAGSTLQSRRVYVPVAWR